MKYIVSQIKEKINASNFRDWFLFHKNQRSIFLLLLWPP